MVAYRRTRVVGMKKWETAPLPAVTELARLAELVMAAARAVSTHRHGHQKAGYREPEGGSRWGSRIQVSCCPTINPSVRLSRSSSTRVEGRQRQEASLPGSASVRGNLARELALMTAAGQCLLRTSAALPVRHPEMLPLPPSTPQGITSIDEASASTGTEETETEPASGRRPKLVPPRKTRGIAMAASVPETMGRNLCERLGTGRNSRSVRPSRVGVLRPRSIAAEAAGAEAAPGKTTIPGRGEARRLTGGARFCHQEEARRRDRRCQPARR